jgi:hypothetical protein
MIKKLVIILLFMLIFYNVTDAKEHNAIIAMISEYNVELKGGEKARYLEVHHQLKKIKAQLGTQINGGDRVQALDDNVEYLVTWYGNNGKINMFKFDCDKRKESLCWEFCGDIESIFEGGRVLGVIKSQINIKTGKAITGVKGTKILLTNGRKSITCLVIEGEVTFENNDNIVVLNKYDKGIIIGENIPVVYRVDNQYLCNEIGLSIHSNGLPNYFKNEFRNYIVYSAQQNDSSRGVVGQSPTYIQSVPTYTNNIRENYTKVPMVNGSATKSSNIPTVSGMKERQLNVPYVEKTDFGTFKYESNIPEYSFPKQQEIIGQYQVAPSGMTMPNGATLHGSAAGIQMPQGVIGQGSPTGFQTFQYQGSQFIPQSYNLQQIPPIIPYKNFP